MAESIEVAVVYARPERQALLRVTLPRGSTLDQAIQASGVLQKFPEIDLARCKVGVFGKLLGLDSPLQEQDRVEIYRPLIADPKEVRRQRAAQGKAMKKGGE